MQNYDETTNYRQRAAQNGFIQQAGVRLHNAHIYQMKICPQCKQLKENFEFALCRTSKSGLSSWCKPCRNVDRKLKQKRYRKYDRNRKKNPNEKVKMWCKRQVYTAKKKGLLVVQPCEVCGSTTKIQGHHDNYFLPLKVKWLCQTHHAQRHYELEQMAKEQGKEAHPFFQVPEQVGPNTLQGKLL